MAISQPSSLWKTAVKPIVRVYVCVRVISAENQEFLTNPYEAPLNG